MIPSFEALMRCAKSLHDKELRTLKYSKPFFVIVESGTLKITPGDTAKQRTAQPSEISALLKQLEESASFRPSEYKAGSRNASYLLALVREWQSGCWDASSPPIERAFSGKPGPVAQVRLSR